MFVVRFKIVPFSLIALFVLASCAPTAGAPEVSPEILSLDASRIDGGERVRYEWEVDPNSSTAETWLWVWTGEQERPEWPSRETLPFALDECDNANVECVGDSVRFHHELPADTDYYQVYVGEFRDGGPTSEIEVQSSIGRLEN